MLEWALLPAVLRCFVARRITCATYPNQPLATRRPDLLQAGATDGPGPMVPTGARAAEQALESAGVRPTEAVASCHWAEHQRRCRAAGGLTTSASASAPLGRSLAFS
jgi:hypothetical protein